MAHDQRPATTTPTVLREHKAQGEEVELRFPNNETPAAPKSQEAEVAWRRTETIFPNKGQTIFPDGPPGAIYEVTITGTIRYRFKVRHPDIWSDRPQLTVTGSADAQYMTTLHPRFHSDDRYRDTGLFQESHDWLRINDRSISAYTVLDKNGRADRWGLAADRKAHIYRLHIRNLRDPLVIAFEADLNSWANGKADFSARGCFTVSVTASILRPSEDEFSSEQPGDTRKLGYLAVDKHGKLIPPIVSATSATVQAEVFTLYLEAEGLHGWEDEAFQQRYAEAHTEQLLDQAPEIRRVHQELLSSNHGGKVEAIYYLEQHYPVVLKRLRGRLNALALAEQISSAADRHKPTPDEWRERQVRHLQTMARDQALKLEAQIEAELEIHDWLDWKEQSIRENLKLTEAEQTRRIDAVRAVAKLYLGNGDTTDAPQKPQPEIL